ncbi:hypothetical protein WJX73_002637 [Symbiochloris irregularis]|uniref:Fungal lipase-type domain-containing protein n=1 Tax=Symbiochloris irregularis TaxID=706552 RepID=A0AAW1PDL4_9CHLO
MGHVRRAVDDDQTGQTVSLKGSTANSIFSRELATSSGYATWDADAQELVLCFKGELDLSKIKPKDIPDKMRAAFWSKPLEAPSWLVKAAPDAMVHGAILHLFDVLRTTDGQDLATAIEALTGGEAPHRIKCLGWCVGGMLATLAAVWAALKYPSADVRAISFGAQKVGNHSFAMVFKYLIGLSYRVVYHRDPAPTLKNKRRMPFLRDRLHHVHGEIFMADEFLRIADQPEDQPFNWEDHNWQKYSRALEDLCCTEAERVDSGNAQARDVMRQMARGDTLKRRGSQLPAVFGLKSEGDAATLEQVLIAGKISQAAVLSAAAYESESEFRSVSGIPNARLVVDKDERNTHVHVGWLEDGTVIMAFRGTATVQDGLADVKILRLDVRFLTQHFPGSRAHLGFLQQFVGVCNPNKPGNDLGAVVMDLSGGRTPTRVLCCGHSLGGALATLGSAWAALQWPDADVRCITFGSPRVGNQAFKMAFHSLVGTSLRLVHGADPVPTLPPSLLYTHVQGAIFVKPGGAIPLNTGLQY